MVERESKRAVRLGWIIVNPSVELSKMRCEIVLHQCVTAGKGLCIELDAKIGTKIETWFAVICIFPLAFLMCLVNGLVACGFIDRIENHLCHSQLNGNPLECRTSHVTAHFRKSAITISHVRLTSPGICLGLIIWLIMRTPSGDSLACRRLQRWLKTKCDSNKFQADVIAMKRILLAALILASNNAK